MPHVKAAFDILEAQIPKFAELNPKYMLYVGWRHDCKRWWYDIFAQRLGIEHIDVLEVYKPNLTDLESRVWAGEYPLIEKTIHGDIRKLDEYGLNDWDIIFWDHGPEHIDLADLVPTTRELKTRCRLLIYACPWGHWPQGVEDGNECEIHRYDAEPEHFESLGFTVLKVGASGQAGLGELVSYWYWRADDNL